MLSQKQWKLQQLAQHMMSTATSASSEAAYMSSMRQMMSKEHGIIAEEMTGISKRIISAIEKNVFGGLSDGDFDDMIINMSKRTSYLALNAALLACKVKEHKAMAVFAELIRDASLEMGELYGLTPAYMDVPEVSPRSSVVIDWFFMFTAVSGGYVWRENAHLVSEVCDYRHDLITGNRLIIKNAVRDMDMPFIQLGSVPKNPGVVIITNAFNPRKQYAVLAEINVNSLINSHIGVSKPCNADIPVRDCWAASDGKDLIFPDWERLVK